MSKFSDLNYYLRSLAGEIEDIENDENKVSLQKAFAIVESQIDEIQGDLESIKYDTDNLV